MRKKNIKNFKPASKDELFENESVIENLKQENENLRNVVKEITIENEANKNKVIILEKRLKKLKKICSSILKKKKIKSQNLQMKYVSGIFILLL